MESSFTPEELAELERQLSCPDGEMGLQVGEGMNKSNLGMTLNTIQFLQLQEANKVLELGHGNCGHLPKIIKNRPSLQYVGLEISKTMYEVATKSFKVPRVEFQLYDGIKIPFDNNFFDAVFSVNTIYFWQEPHSFIKEIERVLKNDGICVLTYAEKSFMKKLPFVKDKFKLFDQKGIRNLVSSSKLRISGFQTKREKVLSKSGESVERVYTMVKLKK